MARARIKAVALAASGVSAFAAAIVAAALIAVFVNSPGQVALAVGNGDVLDVITMIVGHLAAVCVRVFRLL